MPNPEPLHPGNYYHVYNRGNNRETIFRAAENYRYFLRRYAEYIEPVAVLYAYCLLPNHFHLLLSIRTSEQQQEWHRQHRRRENWRQIEPSLAFKNFFVSYAMSINRRYGRTGSLFQKPFKRKLIDSERYLLALTQYIHRNPQRHGLVDDFRDWPWSSYSAIVHDGPTRVDRDTVLGWFDGRRNFVEAHEDDVDDELAADFGDW